MLQILCITNNNVASSWVGYALLMGKPVKIKEILESWSKLEGTRIWTILHSSRFDKSSDIEQQPPYGDRKYSKTLLQNRGGGLQNQREHHIN